MHILKSATLGTGMHATQVTQHESGEVILMACGPNANAMVHVKLTHLPALIAFLQACTPAEPAECTR